MTALAGRRFALVLGGGGTRGFAHVGVIEALEAAGQSPAQVVGSSMGALIGAVWCAGTSPSEMRNLLEELRRADLFRIAHRDMAFKRMRSPGLYRPEPLADVVGGLLGHVTFGDLERLMLVSTVDINTGEQVIWGGPGHEDVPVVDTVLASCALPGFLPPHPVRGAWCVDGSVAGNLPVHAVTAPCDVIVTVDVGGKAGEREGYQDEGFATVWTRAIELGIRRIDEIRLAHWQTPPLLLVRPDVGRVRLLDFRKNLVLADAGRVAMERALGGGVTEPV
jgi:NTE family protein